MTLADFIEYLEMPEKYIPHGDYCYAEQKCPFWDMKPGEYPEQEDGYCYLLGMSDWELNEFYTSSNKVFVVQDGKTELVEDPTAELVGDEIDPVSGLKMHFPYSLLWDQCKECNYNRDYLEDHEMVQVEVKT